MDMPLTRLVIVATQFIRKEVDTDIFRLALHDFVPSLSAEALDRLANQLSKLNPMGL